MSKASTQSKIAKIDYSIFVGQPLRVLSSRKHSNKDKKGVFVTTFTSHLNPNKRVPLVSFGFNEYKPSDFVTMASSKGYYNLVDMCSTDDYDVINKELQSWDSTLALMNTLS